MLALAHYRAMTCPGCGGWLPDTTKVDAEAYQVEPPHRCGKCTALSIAQEKHGKDHQHMHATRWSARLRGEAPLT